MVLLRRGTWQAELQAAALAQPHRLAPPQLHWDAGFQGQSCHNSCSAVASHWAQSLCLVHMQFCQLSHGDDGCKSPVKASSVPWVLRDKADEICQESASATLMTTSHSRQDALLCT